jgi:hypothetical protein
MVLALLLEISSSPIDHFCLDGPDIYESKPVEWFSHATRLLRAGPRNYGKKKTPSFGMRSYCFRLSRKDYDCGAVGTGCFGHVGKVAPYSLPAGHPAKSGLACIKPGVAATLRFLSPKIP